MTNECLMTKHEVIEHQASSFRFWTSDFGFLWSFVLRHSSFRPRPAAAPEREQGKDEHGHGVADDPQPDAEGNPLVPTAEDNERAADQRGQDSLAEKAKEEQSRGRFFEPL